MEVIKNRERFEASDDLVSFVSSGLESFHHVCVIFPSAPENIEKDLMLSAKMKGKMCDSPQDRSMSDNPTHFPS